MFLLKVVLAAVAILVTASLPAHADPITAAIFGAAFAATTAGELVSIGIGLAISYGVSLIEKALTPKPKATDAAGVVLDVDMGDDVAIKFIAGKYATAGRRKYIGSWGEEDGTPNAYLTDVIEISSMPNYSGALGLTSMWINDTQVGVRWDQPHPDGRGYPIVEFRGDSGKDYLWVKYYDGTQTAPDPFLYAKFASQPDRPFLGDMIGIGCQYIILTARVDQNYFSGGIPQGLYEPHPMPLYDIRKDSTNGGSGGHRWNVPSTYEVTQNPAVIIYNLIRGIYYGAEWVYGGQNLAAFRLPASNWIAAANACDAPVQISDGTYEASYRCGYEFSGDEKPSDAIEKIRKAANARIAEVGGIFKILIGAPGGAVFGFTDNDILITEDQTYTPFPTLDDTVNGIESTYPEPTEKWASKDAPARYSPDLEVLDGNRRLAVSVTFEAVPFANQVQRLMVAMIQEDRRFRQHTFYLPPDAYTLEPNDVVSYTSERNGYSNKKFLVSTITGPRSFNQLVTLKEIDPSDYDWNSTLELPTSTGWVGPITPPSQPMTGWTVEPATVQDANGIDRRPAIKVNCAGDLDDVNKVWVQVRVKATQAVVFDSDQTPYGVPYSWVISGGWTLPNTEYEVAGKYIPFTNRPTDWSAWLSVTTPNVLIATVDIFDNAIIETKIADAAITAAKIMDEAITSLKLADAAVTTAKIQLAAVTADVLASGSVISTKLADAAVTAQKLAAGAVDATKFAAGIEPVTNISDGAGVPTTKSTTNISYQGQLYTWNGTQYVTPSTSVADGSITAAKIASGAIDASKLASAAVTSVALAANAVATANIQVGAITNAVIAAGAVDSGKLASAAVTASALANGAVTNVALASNAVATSNIQVGAVVSASIGAGAVIASTIGAGAVTTGALAAGAVTANTIAANAVTAAAIAANTITGDKIVAGAITASKLTLTDFTNLVPDNQMIDTSSWYGAGWSQVTNNPNLGSGIGMASKYCYAYTPASGATGYTPEFGSNQFAVKPGQQYLVTGQAYANFAQAPLIRIHFFDAGNTTLISTVVVLDKSAGVPAGFNTATVTVTAPAGAFLARITAYVQQTNTSGPVYVGGFSAFAKNAASLIVDGTITANLIGAAAITAGKLDVGAVTAGTIAANAVTATTIAANAVTAAAIAANTITGAKMVADTITARELLLTDFTNLIPDGDWAYNPLDGATWNYAGSNANIQYLANGYSSDGNGAVNIARTVANGTIDTSIQLLPASFISVAAGDVMYWEIAFWTNVTASTSGGYYRILWYDGTKTWLGSYADVVQNVPITGTRVTYSGQLTIPANAKFAQIQLINAQSNTTSVNMIVDRVILRKANAAQLIVDGSIQARSLQIGAFAANLVSNGDFESGIYNWSFLSGIGSYGSFYTQAGGQSGTLCMVLDKGTGASTEALAIVSTTYAQVEEALNYVLSAYFAGFGTASAAGAYLRAYWYDVNQAPIPGTPYTDAYANGAVAAGWSQASGVVKAPVGARFARFAVLNWQTSTIRYLGVDAISFSKAVTATSIVDGTITASKIAADTITAAQIAAGAISTSELAAGAITSGKIAAGAITAATLAVGTSSNLIQNSDFSAGLTNWRQEFSPDPADFTVTLRTDGYAIQGGAVMQIYKVNADTGSQYYGVQPGDPATAVTGGFNVATAGKKYTVVAGQTYEFSFYYSGINGSVIGYIAFLDVNGVALAYSSPGEVAANQQSTGANNNYDLSKYGRYFFIGVAPAGAVTAFPFVRHNGTRNGASQSWVFLTEWLFGLGNPNQTSPSAWAPAGVTVINGGSIVANSITADNIAANTITAGQLAAGAVTAATIAAGAVTAVSIAASSITGDKLAANTIGANQIAADAITARTLVLTDFSNIADNGWQTGSLDGWSTSFVTSFLNDTGAGDAAGWRLETLARDTLSNAIACSLGDAFYFDVWVYNTDSTNAAVYAFVHKADGTAASMLVAQTATKNAWTRLTGKYTVTSGYVTIAMDLMTLRTAGSGSSTYWSKPTMRRATNASMIVDGSVTAASIAANSITADRLSVTSLAAVSATLGTVDISSAYIGSLTVGTSNIASGAVTSVGVGRTAGTQNIASNATVNLASCAVVVGGDSRVVIDAMTIGQYNSKGPSGGAQAIGCNIFRGGSAIFSQTYYLPVVFTQVTQSTQSGGTATTQTYTSGMVSVSGLYDAPGVGNFSYTLQIYCPGATIGWNESNITASCSKR